MVERVGDGKDGVSVCVGGGGAVGGWGGCGAWGMHSLGDHACITAAGPFLTKELRKDW